MLVTRARHASPRGRHWSAGHTTTYQDESAPHGDGGHRQHHGGHAGSGQRQPATTGSRCGSSVLPLSGRGVGAGLGNVGVLLSSTRLGV